jgi:hypothetical protein
MTYKYRKHVLTFTDGCLYSMEKYRLQRKGLIFWRTIEEFPSESILNQHAKKIGADPETYYLTSNIDHIG